MARKKFVMAGRPLGDPDQILSTAARAMISRKVAVALQTDMERTGIPFPPDGRIASDIVRIALYERLKRTGLLEEYDLENDSTWRSLRERGLI